MSLTKISSSQSNEASQQQQQQPQPPDHQAYIPEPDIVYDAEVELDPQSPNSPNPEANTNGVVTRHTKRELRGAAVAGGLVGLAVGGPILGAVAAGGCALAATAKGQVGQVARAGGEAVACVGDRVKKMDQKHRIVEKTGKGITKGCNWVAKKVKPRDAPANACPPMH